MWRCMSASLVLMCASRSWLHAPASLVLDAVTGRSKPPPPACACAGSEGPASAPDMERGTLCPVDADPDLEDGSDDPWVGLAPPLAGPG